MVFPKRSLSKNKKTEHLKIKADRVSWEKVICLGPLKARFALRGYQQEEKIFNHFKSFSISRREADFKVRSGVEREGSWVDPILAHVKF